eukprot:5572447-Ditylum_brightwellii.AAC.1
MQYGTCPILSHKLLPGALDLFVSKVPALQWFHYSLREHIFDTTLHDFGVVQVIAAGIAMSRAAACSPSFLALLCPGPTSRPPQPSPTY